MKALDIFNNYNLLKKQLEDSARAISSFIGLRDSIPMEIINVYEENRKQIQNAINIDYIDVEDLLTEINLIFSSVKRMNANDNDYQIDEMLEDIKYSIIEEIRKLQKIEK